MCGQGDTVSAVTLKLAGVAERLRRISTTISIKPETDTIIAMRPLRCAFDTRLVLSRTPFSTTSGGGGRLQQLRARLQADGRPLPRAPASFIVSNPAEALTDTFGRRHSYLRISLTERCNLRCTYCMPHEGVQLTPSLRLLTVPETLRLAGLFVRLGVSKIRLTGGEPTLRPDLVDVCSALREIPRLDVLAMTSNGVLLGAAGGGAAPLLPALRAAGLTHLNLSLDTLRRERFEKISRRPATHWDRVMAAIEAAQGLGLSSLKLNVVVSRGVNADEVPDFAALTAAAPLLTVRFIELMPFSGNDWAPDRVVPSEELVRAIRARFPSFSRLHNGDGNATEQLWAISENAGRVGFISSMTDAFCSSCNRIRLTADGSLKVCLHGSDELSLRDLMRAGADDEGLTKSIAGAIGLKHAALGGNGDMHGIASAVQSGANARAMIRIGG